uniref:CCHC-type domain-containing protein n=1 Tax=Tanacetum cinerariifolium TaxID=118510 RepID=A0A6L2MPA1_TANCI|nr:hypothetical protein [Tanacetum cinerariifolium]
MSFSSQAWTKLFRIQEPMIHEYVLEFLSTISFKDHVMELDVNDTMDGGELVDVPWHVASAALRVVTRGQETTLYDVVKLGDLVIVRFNGLGHAEIVNEMLDDSNEEADAIEARRARDENEGSPRRCPNISFTNKLKVMDDRLVEIDQHIYRFGDEVEELTEVVSSKFSELLLQSRAMKAVSSKKKVVVITFDPLALVTEKNELKKITALLAKAFNRKKFYAKPTNNNLRTFSATSSANKKQEYVKSDDKKEDKKVDEKKRDMCKVKCYNCKKEGHFAKDCKKAKVKDYEYYKTKMLLAKKDSDEQVLLAEDHAWMESSSDSIRRLMQVCLHGSNGKDSF